MTFIKKNAQKLMLFVFLALTVLFFAACDKKPSADEKMVEEAINSIAIIIERKTFKIPRNTTIKHNLEIEWELECEDGTAKLEKRGEFWYVVMTPTPYEENEEGEQINDWGYAKLKATVSKGKYSKTREWDVDVPPGDKIIPISEIKTEYQNNDPVELTDVLVVHRIEGQGFLVQDETGAIYIYDRGNAGDVKVGDIVSIEGKISFYGDAIQVSDPEVLVSLSDEPVSYEDAPEKTVAEILRLDTEDQGNFYVLYKLEGYVRQSKSGSYDRFHIEAGGQQIMLHYNALSKATENELKELKDKYISFCAYTYVRNQQKMTLMILPDTIEEIEEPELTDEEKVDLAVDYLTATYDGKTFYNDLDLITKDARNVTISWSSNKPNVISNQGKLTMPDTDTEVTLTATVIFGASEKEVTIKVIAKGVALSTVKQAIDLIDNGDLDFVRTVGVIIGLDQQGNYYVADETGVIFVQDNIGDLAVGNKVEILGKGKVDNRSSKYIRMIYDVYTVKKVDNDNHDDPLTYADAAVSDFDFTITSANIKTAVPSEELYGKGLLFEGYIVLVGDKVYLVDELGEDAQTIYVTDQSKSIGSLKNLAESKVTLKILVYGYSVDEGWILGFLGRTGDLELSEDLSDQQKISIAVEDILDIVKDGDDVDADLNFVTEARDSLIEGVKYVWTTDNLAVIDATGKFTAPAEDTAVKITVKIYLSGDTSGEADHTVEINVTALADMQRISDIKKLSVGTEIEITGVVAFVFESGFILTDRTGGLYVYGTESAAVVSVGDKVYVTGELDLLNKVPDTVQVKFPEVEILSSDNPVDFTNPIEVTVEELLAWDRFDMDNHYKLIKTEGYVREITSGSYTNYYLEDILGNQVMFHFFALDDNLESQLAALKDKYISLTTYTFSIHQSQLTIMYLPELAEEKAAPDLTAEQKLAIARAEIDKIVVEGAKVNYNLTFIGETNNDRISGAKYVWTVDRTDIFDSEGVFTEPDEDTPVKITVKVYLSGEIEGDPDATWEINVTATPVPVVDSDLFISEYSEGSKGHNKYIEIYNPLSVAVDLSGYSVALYSNGKTEGNKLELEGTLAPGATYVVANGQAVLQILDKADKTDSNVINFNGDDAFALFKGDEVIDIIGVIGERPEDDGGWKIGDVVATKDHTLIRKPSVSGPSAQWNPDEWFVENMNDWDDLGSHTMN
ncbi:MAG: immunoglobulin-like domain-containing protein [Bacilli bacterium]